FSTIAVIFITFFIFHRGFPLFKKVSISEFLFTTYWLPSDEINPGFGILSFIVGSFFVTFAALSLGVPLGIACAIFLAEIAEGRIAKVLRSVVELLAGIPSVIYGFFGIIVISKGIRLLFGGTGYCVLSASIILAIMILPTIVNISEVSLRAVPEEYKEGSFALGATHWQTIVCVLLPAARSGIIAGIVLGIGRAVGETMAVLMVAGNAPIMPTGLLSKVRTLTMNIATDMGYASGDHMTALFTTGIVLFVFIMSLTIVVNVLSRKKINPKR
ncbi:phosphate ABC transporter permease subunit PstC, partial [bacterium]|nr:phosphate ABC transporter permease subunit PstC [bacterium]